MREIKIAPSLLSADFANLASETKKCEDGGADILHADIMDGRFVPNITFGPIIVEAVRRHTNLPIDCHLMVENPEPFIEDFVKAGANYISVHAEGRAHLHRALKLIKDLGAKAGVALNPATPLNFAFDAADFADFILLMSVDPGFGGQKFIDAFLKRAETLRNFLITKSYPHIDIEVDGGIKIDNVANVVRAGANILVSGTGLFKGDLSANIAKMKKIAIEAKANY